MTKRYLEVLLISIISVLCTLYFVGAPKVIDGGSPWSNGFDNRFGCNTEDITDMYADYVEEWKIDIKKSFDTAESQILKNKPTPDVVGPDPDPDKCVCKGSGIIVQGDGHKTPCPYHGRKNMLRNTESIKPLLILEK